MKARSGSPGSTEGPPASPCRHHPAARNRAETLALYLAPVTAPGRIAADDPRKPDVQALLARHRAFALGQTPPEHAFALGAAELLDPAITFFSLREDGSLLGIGAIRQLDPQHAEIK